MYETTGSNDINIILVKAKLRNRYHLPQRKRLAFLHPRSTTRASFEITDLSLLSIMAPDTTLLHRLIRRITTLHICIRALQASVDHLVMPCLAPLQRTILEHLVLLP